MNLEVAGITLTYSTKTNNAQMHPVVSFIGVSALKQAGIFYNSHFPQ